MSRVYEPLKPNCFSIGLAHKTNSCTSSKSPLP